MTDCPNAEMRDRLPDLLHERLEMSVRELVVAHVAACTDCQEELDLLRAMRGELTRAVPVVNVASIVAALPQAPRALAPRVAARTQRSWGSWRVAAAVTFLAVGGTSVALVSRMHSGSPIDSSGLVATAPAAGDSSVSNAAHAPSVHPSAAVAAGVGGSSAPNASASRPSAVTAEVADASTDATGEVPTDARFNGLNRRQLKALLGQLDQLEALPVTEPEPVSIRVNSSTSGEPEGEW